MCGRRDRLLLRRLLERAFPGVMSNPETATLICQGMYFASFERKSEAWCTTLHMFCCCYSCSVNISVTSSFTHCTSAHPDICHRRWAFERLFHKTHVDYDVACADVKQIFGRLWYVDMTIALELLPLLFLDSMYFKLKA
jgi:hypothetical protein